MDDLTPENFELLLTWLHPDREEAGREYERIRVLLIRKFSSHACSSAETLADQTMDRVARTLTPEFVERWEGKQERYFYRVAFYILCEERAKGNKEDELPPDLIVVVIDNKDERERRLNCQDKCLMELPKDKRDLIIKYYGGDRATKIKNRDELARKLKVTLPVLRVKAHRIRRVLRTCIEKCLEAAEAFEA